MTKRIIIVIVPVSHYESLNDKFPIPNHRIVKRKFFTVEIAFQSAYSPEGERQLCKGCAQDEGDVCH